MIKWIDSLEFENYGGFTKETQFVREMGQGYLFSCGTPGVPVESASTTFSVEEKGMYRIWLRVKNWYRQGSPGRLALLVDEKYLKKEMGMLPISDWHFEVGGDIMLEKGEHTIKIEDLSGYFGRFSSVIITNDMDFMPEQPVDRMLLQRAKIRGQKLEPTFVGDFDLVVCGGGPGGVPAAIAAARKGLKVALVHSRPGLGGNGSEEGFVGFDGASSNFPFMREGGIAEEIHRIREQKITSWEQAMKEICAKEDTLTIYYNNFVIDAYTEDDVIKKVKSVNTNTGEYFEFSAKYFADCTGDGWLAYYSGAKYRLGREAKWQYGEKFAPEQPDNNSMSGCLAGILDEKRNTLGYLAEDVGEPYPFTAPEWAVKLPENIYRTPQTLNISEWWVENPNNMDDLWHEEEIRDELLRLNLGYFHWLKNYYERRDVVKNYKLVGFAKYNAKRETRRIMGDYVMTQNDCEIGRVFDDAVSYCGWMLDIHHPKGLYSGAEGPFDAAMRIPLTTVPYRVLYSKNINNLFMAGRCISVSHLGLGSVRVQNTLATLGQVVGTAVSMCLEKNISPRDIYTDYIKDLQQLLLKDDMFIPTIKNDDKNDKARFAKITADSVSKTDIYNTKKGVEGDLKELTNPVMIAMPLREEKPNMCEVYFKNESGEDKTLTATVFIAFNHKNLEKQSTFEELTVTIPKEFDGNFTFPFKFNDDYDNLPDDTDAEHRKRLVGLKISKCEGVFLKEFLLSSFQKVRAYPLSETRWHTDTRNSYCFNLYNDIFDKANCSPENVINGYNRMVSPSEYSYVSDETMELPQSLYLNWDKPQEISEVRITFDSDLNNPTFSYQRLPIARRLVKDYFISVLVNGEWEKVSQCNDNILRHNIHKFPEKILCDGIKITVTATYGDKSARIFEVRAY